MEDPISTTSVPKPRSRARPRASRSGNASASTTAPVTPPTPMSSSPSTENPRVETSGNFWEWSFYEPANRPDAPKKRGECGNPSVCEGEEFWREFWPRCKNAPQILFGNPLGDFVVVGYKSRRTINEAVVSVIREISSFDDEEMTKYRGDLMIFRRTDGKTDGYPPEYLVRCEGENDDTIDISLLLLREGVEKDRPGPHTFAYMRNRVRTILFELLTDYVMTRDAERGILEQTIRETFSHTTSRIWKDPIVKQIYKTTFTRVWRNLLPTSHPQSVGNPKLLLNVRAGLISAEDLASLPPHKLWPEKWQHLEETRILKQIATLEGDEASASTTDMFQCRKCKERKTRYYQMQTRSADEPMTTFIYCVVCGNRWKE
jgi:hypothetical protein